MIRTRMRNRSRPNSSLLKVEEAAIQLEELLEERILTLWFVKRDAKFRTGREHM